MNDLVKTLTEAHICEAMNGLYVQCARGRAEGIRNGAVKKIADIVYKTN